jgi:intergrase/recombinase
MTKPIKVEIKKLLTMADIGLGVERPLNREKRNWIKSLTKNKTQKPILVAPIKDSGYFILLDGWHRVQALKKQKKKTAIAIKVPVAQGLQLAKANKILRDVDRDSKFKLKVSGLINDWAQSQIDK